MIYRTRSQLLKQVPILFCIFGRRKIDAVLVTQFLVAEPEECTKGWIHEERLPFQSLHHDSNRTCVENITEELGVRCPAWRKMAHLSHGIYHCLCSTTTNISDKLIARADEVLQRSRQAMER